MSILTKQELEASLDSADADSLFIEPLLDRGQVGAVSIDLRLGYDFLVSIVTRQPSIQLSESERKRSIGSYFQETRRDMGEPFLLYPNQVVLATTLEYIALPTDVYADILSRSSYTRLGISIGTMVQPGFRGCVPLELFNHGNNAIELVVGARICQVRLSRLGKRVDYTEKPRKYYGEVRPVVSRADQDKDLDTLAELVKAKRRDGNRS